MKQAEDKKTPTPEEYNEAQEAQKDKQPALSTGDGSKVFAAISKIMAEVGTVKKDGKNTFHNYAYATAADIAHALQKKVADAGLVIVQTETKMEAHFDNSILTVEYSFILSHISGDQLPFIITKTGASSLKNSKGGIDDKAINKCSTAALKYFLLGLFLIPTGDYDDADADGDTDNAPARPRGNQNAKTQAPVPQVEKPIEEVSAPLDPETGTLSPHAIKVPIVNGKGDPVAWSALYIAAINTTENEEQLSKWVGFNKKLMSDVAKYAANAHKSIVEALDAKRAAFEASKKVSAG